MCASKIIEIMRHKTEQTLIGRGLSFKRKFLISYTTDRSKTKQYVVQNALPDVEQNKPEESSHDCIGLNRKVGFTLSSSSPSSSSLKPMASPSS
jgi:hypothetical protein